VNVENFGISGRGVLKEISAKKGGFQKGVLEKGERLRRNMKNHVQHQ